MNKKVLIVCYSFPPYFGIGGRRWAKFSKYIKLLGTEVFVISSKNPFKEKSNWTTDIEGINVTRLPLIYPKALISFPKSIVGRLRYKFSIFILKLRTKGNYYDKTIFWEKQFLNQAKKIIEENQIKNIIVSGAPFHLTTYCLKLKEWDSNLNLIVDFRDFWTDDLSLGPLGSISQKRINYELELEKKVFKKADYIITVSEFISKTLINKHSSNKVLTIINGFDEDDYDSKLSASKKSNDIKFVFTGTLYQNINTSFIPFCKAIRLLKNNEPDLYNMVTFDFYGSSSQFNIDLVKQYELDNVSFHKNLPLTQAYKIVAEADYCMLFLNDSYTFSLSTKFCEYIGLRKSIVLFSKQGESSDFIQQNSLGFWINPEETYENLLGLIKSKNKIEINERYEEVRANFIIKNISNQLNELIKF